LRNLTLSPIFNAMINCFKIQFFADNQQI